MGSYIYRFLCFLFLLVHTVHRSQAQSSNCNLLCNVDFEDRQLVSPGFMGFFSQSAVTCWKTTATDGMIEIWGTGFGNVDAYSGKQFAELNANMVSTLYQDFTASLSSDITISFAHRGRNGTDVLSLEIGPVGGPYTSLGTYSADNTAWKYNTASYTFPSSGGTDYTLRFKSVSSAGGNPGIGNFLDDISIVLTKPVITSNIIQPTCSNASNGSIELLLAGGNSPFTYSWLPPINSNKNKVQSLGVGNYEVQITDFYGCTINNKFTLVASNIGENDTQNLDACDSFYWSQNGKTYKSDGIYTTFYKNRFGCDSNKVILLNVNRSYLNKQVFSSCGAYVWTQNGRTYTSGGKYSIQLKSMHGCDSVFLLDLTINKASIKTFDAKAKDNYQWIVNGKTYYQSGTYSENYKTQSGCDSLFILNLLIDKNDTIYLPTAFTPDGNGVNDKWGPVGNNIDWYEIQIYNRWGELIYRGARNQAFDGIYKGRRLMDGVYAYLVEVYNKEGERTYLKGIITIIH